MVCVHGVDHTKRPPPPVAAVARHGCACAYREGGEPFCSRLDLEIASTGDAEPALNHWLAWVWLTVPVSRNNRRRVGHLPPAPAHLPDCYDSHPTRTAAVKRHSSRLAPRALGGTQTPPVPPLLEATAVRTGPRPPCLCRRSTVAEQYSWGILQNSHTLRQCPHQLQAPSATYQGPFWRCRCHPDSSQRHMPFAPSLRRVGRYRGRQGAPKRAPPLATIAGVQE